MVSMHAYAAVDLWQLGLICAMLLSTIFHAASRRLKWGLRIPSGYLFCPECKDSNCRLSVPRNFLPTLITNTDFESHNLAVLPLLS